MILLKSKNHHHDNDLSVKIVFFVMICVVTLTLTNIGEWGASADDPGKYKISSRLAGVDGYDGMHITHNTEIDENNHWERRRIHSSNNGDGKEENNFEFVNKKGQLVHRYVVKIKDHLVENTKREVGLIYSDDKNQGDDHHHQQEDIEYSDRYNNNNNNKENGKEQPPPSSSSGQNIKRPLLKESDLDIDYMTAMNKKIQTIAEGHGFHYVKSIGYAPGVYIFERPWEQKEIEHQMNESADIEWYEQLYEPRQRVKRYTKESNNNNNHDGDDDDNIKKDTDTDILSNYWEQPLKNDFRKARQRRLLSYYINDEKIKNGYSLPSSEQPINPEGQYNPYSVDLYFNDPLWSDQWNLADRDVRGDSLRPGLPININVYPAWASGITGAGVIIGIVDDGVQSLHPEMVGSVQNDGGGGGSSPKYANDLSWNFNQDTENAEPTPQDKHGTACAGVASAMANNAKCGIGVAYNARVANLKILGSGWTSDAEEASALTHACSLRSFYGHYSRFVNATNNKYAKQTQRKIRKVMVDSSRRASTMNNNMMVTMKKKSNNENGGINKRLDPSSSPSTTTPSPLVSIFSSSWGPVDDGKHWDGPGRITQDGMKHCTEEGRNGLGSIYIVAGGNGRDNMDSSNYDGYANSLYTMAVSAVGDYGGYTWYSEEGANIICAMPSSGTGNRFIISADLAGYQGYSSGDCDTKFGGTSAAAPQLAGMVALMLQANPLLTWRDVQHIIIRSSRMTRSNGIKWSVNSAGRHHSMSLGFGVPDVAHAVSLSKDWRVTEGLETGSSYYHLATGMIYTNEHVAPGRVMSFTWNYTSPFENDQGITVRLEHVHVTLNANTPLGNGYLGVTLCGPSGVCSILSAEGNGQDKSIEWTFQTLRHWDEPIEYIPELEKRPPEIYEKFDFVNKKTTWTLTVANIYTYRSIPINVLSWGIDFYGTIMRKPSQPQQPQPQQQQQQRQQKSKSHSI